MQAFLTWLFGPIWVMVFGRAESARQATLLWTLTVAVERQFPVVPFLEALADEAGGRWRWKVQGLADLISAGVSIPDALEAQPGILPIDFIAMIRTGAMTGNMSGALREAAGLARRHSERTTVQFQGTLFYLCILFLVLTLVCTFVMVFIIPKFKAIFEGFEVKLPVLTEIVIHVSDAAASIWFLFPLAILAIWLSLGVALEFLGRGPWWKTSLRLPSRLWPRFDTPHVLRTLSVAIDGGQPLSDALRVMAERHPDPVLRRRSAQIAAAVEAGDDCWHSLWVAGMLRPGEIAVLGAAQRAGNLAWAMKGIAESIERRAEFRYYVVMQFVQPALLVGMGTVVGMFCVGIFLPLVELLNKLS